MSLFAVETDSHMAAIMAAWTTDQGEWDGQRLDYCQRQSDSIETWRKRHPRCRIQSVITGRL